MPKGARAIIDYMRGGVDAARKLRARIDVGKKRPAEEDTRAALKATRRKLGATRKRLERVSAKLEATTTELHSTRASVRDPNPRVAIPDNVQEVIDNVRAEKLTYLQSPNLQMLSRLVLDAEERGLEGLIIEAGAARGGSAIVLAAAKRPERPMHVYDVFGMIPPPTDADGPDVHARYEKIVREEAAGIGGSLYYGYRDDLYAEVNASFEAMGVPVGEHNVSLIRGLFQETIHIDEPVAIAHLDGDWYESTMTCLERIAPMLVPGGRIVLDDYYKWSGCRTAVDEYFRGRQGFHVEKRSKVHVLRL